MTHTRGYTLIELIVAVGLFAFVMTLASGAYLMMISLNRRAESLATGINSLSFVVETMARSIRTGSSYTCGGLTDCPSGSSSFSLIDDSGRAVSYSLVGNAIQQTVGATTNTLTDSSTRISSLQFYLSGGRPGDALQPYVTITISGQVLYAAGKTEDFTIETGAAMRGSDL